MIDKTIVFLAHMLDEAFNKSAVLCEDKEGKNINRAEKWIKDNHPEVIGQKLENGTTITPRVLTQEIRNIVPNVRMADCKFLVGVTRIYFDLQNDIHDFQSKMNKLNKMLKIICAAHTNEYDNDFNGLLFDQLDKKFSGAVKKELDSDKEEIGKLQLIKNSAYKIVPIDSFKEASKYKEYTSWCVAHHSNMYSNYTKGGLGRFYFCLQDGFENVPEVKGEGCPMDVYGKSMIAISINDDGSLNTCTCRWNHDNGGNDSMMDTKEISKFFGVDFYKTFKPYNIDQLWKKLLKKQVPLHKLNADTIEFCKTFSCIAVDKKDADNIIVFKKLIDGKIITLPYIDKTTTYINNKFATMQSGKFVDAAPKTIQSMLKDVKGDVVIPNSVTSIGKFAFYDCRGLTRVVIPNSVTSIGEWAFCNCRGLTSMVIPNSVTSIDDCMFMSCISLTHVTIPNSVTSIRDHAFKDCSSLTSVMIPDSVVDIGKEAFYGCISLTSMTIPDNVKSIGQWTFYECNSLKSLVFKGKTFKEVKAMKNYPFGIEDESVIKCESDSQMVSETYKIGASNNLWIRSCSDSGIDVNKVSSVNPLYLTQDPDYAYYYSTSKKTDNCILVVKVQNGELCHLYDANDYTSLAKKSKFPPQMAGIFKMIEPYFSFNTTPSINVKRGRVPDQYKEAAKFTIDFNRQNGVKSKSIVQLMLDSRYVDCGDAAANEGLDDVVIGYAQAFDVVHDYMKTVPGYVKHKYVDILQFAFFDMLSKKLGYKGYYCPENSRHSRSYVSTDYKKDKYYFGHAGHTHPCIAMFDGTAIEVVAIVPINAFYIEFADVVDKDSRMLRYSNRAIAIAQVVAQYSKNKGDIFVDRRYSDERVKDARHKIMQVINAKADLVTGDLPREKRSRDQI